MYFVSIVSTRVLLKNTVEQNLHLTIRILQDFVARKWTKISENDGNSLREFLYQGALRQNQIQFITIKYIKVFVNIGLRQWKTNPAFFQQIMVVSNIPMKIWSNFV